MKAAMSSFIHQTAIVASGARLGEGCHIGPFCTIGDEVELGDQVRLESHVVVGGRTSIGRETTVFPFASIGLAPQDLKYKGEATRTEIGERNTIREAVTIHRGTNEGGGVTSMGDDCLLMAQVHIAHDCRLGSGIIMANAASLGGHVEIADRANIGGFSGIHQFCRIGTGAFVGAVSLAVKDVLPYSLVQGNHARCFGLNTTGLRRRGLSKDALRNLKHAFHLLLHSKLNTAQAVGRIREELTDSAEVDHLVEFIESSARGVVLR